MQTQVKAAPLQRMHKNKVLITILDVNGNIRHSGVATVQRMEFASKFVSDSDRDTTDVDAIPQNTTGNKDIKTLIFSSCYLIYKILLNIIIQ